MVAGKSKLADCRGVNEIKMYKYCKQSVPYQWAVGFTVC